MSVDAAPAPPGVGARILEYLVRRRPESFFRLLRLVKPVLAIPNGPVFVTRSSDVRDVLSRHRVFTVSGYAPMMDASVGPFMLARDGTTINQRDKGVLRALLRQEDLPRIRELVAELAGQALAAARTGRLDVVPEVSRLVPIRVVEEYFGFRGPDLATMFRWSRATQADMFHNQQDDPQVHEDNLRAGAEMTACVRDLVSSRRRELEAGARSETALDRMLETRLPAEVGFDEERVLVNTCGFLIGAGETTSAAIVQILDQLLEHPEWMSAARSAADAGDHPRLAAICWEALRFNPVNPFVVRTCAEDAVVGSGWRRTRVKAGAKVLACTRSAMWDAKAMESPREFRPGRPAEDYLHFGFGHHTCLGDQVSAVVIPETVGHLVRLPGLRRDDGPTGRPDAAGGPFPESFTVRFDAA